MLGKVQADGHRPAAVLAVGDELLAGPGTVIDRQGVLTAAIRAGERGMILQVHGTIIEQEINLA